MDYWGVYHSVSKFLQIVCSLSVIDFSCHSVMIRGYTQPVFNSFKFLEVYFMAQDILDLGDYSKRTWKTYVFCCCLMECYSMSTCWLIVLFNHFLLSLLSFTIYLVLTSLSIKWKEIVCYIARFLWGSHGITYIKVLCYY